MRAPSGDHTGARHPPSVGVIRRGSPPSAGTVKTSFAVPRSQSGCRADVNASVRPSGDHAGHSSSWSPSVSCTGSGSVEGDDVQVMRPAFGPPIVVEAVLQTGEPARRSLRDIGLVVVRVVRACGEGEPRPVGRPGRGLDRLGEPGQLPRLPRAVGRKHEELRLVLAARRCECEPAPVRRPPWVAIAFRSCRELPGFGGAVDRHRPDRAPRVVGLFVDPCADERDGPCVRR